jgi:hypothetical protein
MERAHRKGLTSKVVLIGDTKTTDAALLIFNLDTGVVEDERRRSEDVRAFVYAPDDAT